MKKKKGNSVTQHRPCCRTLTYLSPSSDELAFGKDFQKGVWKGLLEILAVVTDEKYYIRTHFQLLDVL